MKIRFLALRTKRELALRSFYTGTLGLTCLTFEENYTVYQVGETVLLFEKGPDPDDEMDPSYHFAIDIPRNQLEKAAAWLSERVDLLKFDGKTEVEHSNWNATSLYFHDPQGNIVEVIARHNLENDREGLFSPESFLRISEIGWPCIFGMPDRDFELPVWSETDDCQAFGSEEGSILVVKNAEPWTPTGERALAHPCVVMIQDEKGVRNYSRR